MSKFKVKIEVVEQLQKLINGGFGYDDKIHLLQDHYKIIYSHGDEVWSLDEFPLLNDLSFSDMYNLLHDNYEIEITVEDEIRNKYYHELRRLNGINEFDDEWSNVKGYLDGIEFVLRKLNREDIIEKFTTKKGGI